MGSGVSSNYELSADEKIKITKTLQQKYDETNNDQNVEDLNLFEVLKEYVLNPSVISFCFNTNNIS
jgi:hypothetical protein